MYSPLSVRRSRAAAWDRRHPCRQRGPARTRNRVPWRS